MGLLDGGTVTAQVYVEAETEDDYGNKVLTPAGEPVPVIGRLQPGTAVEQPEDGQVADTRYRFVSRTFPGGPFAKVVADGKTWDVVGTPKHHTGSAMTQHYTTVLQERGSAPDESSSSSS